MKLPNAHLAVVERETITAYLLNTAHRYGASKARFFATFSFRLDAWEALAQARPDAFLRVVPDLVVEILSPPTAKRDQTEKKAIYERNGVLEYWIVNPRRKAVTVFCLGSLGYDAGRTFTRGMIRSRVLPKLRIAVVKLVAL